LLRVTNFDARHDASRAMVDAMLAAPGHTPPIGGRTAALAGIAAGTA